MSLKKYFFFFAALSLISCDTNNDLSKRLDIVEMDTTYQNGSITEAKTDLVTYLDANTKNEYAWTLLGNIESDLDNDSLAFKAYEKALKLNSKTVEALTGMGIIYRKRGDYEKASDYYYKAIKINPKYAEAYASLVVVNLKRKKFKEAVEVGLKGYNLDKENGIVAANLAASYHFINDTIQREKFFNIAKNNGYKNTEALRQIFDGELTVFD